MKTAEGHLLGRARLGGIWAAIFAAILVIGVCAAGCGDATSGIEGISCSSDGDCMSGLKCLPAWVVADGGCSQMGTECLQPCQTDSDCAAGPSTGLGLTCFSFCGGTASCGAPFDAGTASVTDASDASTDTSTDAPPDSTADGSDTSTE